MLLALFSASFIVKADRTDGQWVAVTQTFDKMLVPPHPGEISKLDSGVIQMRDWQYKYTAHLTVGTTTYQLYAIAPSDEVYNPTTEVLNAHYDIVWYVYTGSIPQVTTDGFSGNFELKLIGVSFPPYVYPPGSEETIHCVLQGFGSFEGQTLALSYDGFPHGGDLTGFLLVK